MIKIWQFIFSLKQLLCGWTHAGTNCCSWYRFVASPSFPSDVFNSWSFAWQDFERSGLWRGPFGHKSFSAWSQQRLQEAGCGLTGQPSGHRSKIPSQWRPHLDGDPILMETPPTRRPHPDGDYIPKEIPSQRRPHPQGDPIPKETPSWLRLHPRGDPISMETPPTRRSHLNGYSIPKEIPSRWRLHPQTVTELLTSLCNFGIIEPG